MAKILISVLSEQTIPNILLIKEFKEIDKHIFITTEEMEKNSIDKYIINASGLGTNSKIQKLIVKQHDIEDIEQNLSTLSLNTSDQLIVNITGGTKIMTLAVFSFFKEKNAEILYVVANKNRYTKIFPKSDKRNFKLNSKLSVRNFLAAYGFETKNQADISHPPEVTEKIFNFFSAFFKPGMPEPYYLPAIMKLQRFRKKKTISTSQIEGLDKMLSDMSYIPTVKGELNKDEIVFLTGGWFEEHIYNRVKTELNLADEFITTGMQITKDNVPNEFDVAFIYNNKIYMTECKTSVYYFEDGRKKTTIGDFVYKADSLQSELGLYPITTIATLSALFDDSGKINSIAETHYNRAKLYNVKILAYRDLTNGATVKELLGID